MASVAFLLEVMLSGHTERRQVICYFEGDPASLLPLKYYFQTPDQSDEEAFFCTNTQEDIPSAVHVYLFYVRTVLIDCSFTGFDGRVPLLSKYHNLCVE